VLAEVAGIALLLAIRHIAQAGMELWCLAILQPSLETFTGSWLVDTVGAVPWTTVHTHPVLHMLLVKAGMVAERALAVAALGEHREVGVAAALFSVLLQFRPW
jgi:hypothetical protein